jgi:hypothetical protein
MLCLIRLPSTIYLIHPTMYALWGRGNAFVGRALLAVSCRILLRRSRLNPHPHPLHTHHADFLYQPLQQDHVPLGPLC